jgi:Pre-toxin TG/Pretoxin HINT domain
MANIYIKLAGLAEGGTLTIQALLPGEVISFVEPTQEFETPRQLIDRVASHLDSLKPALGARLDNAGGVLLFEDVEDLQIISGDPGLIGTDVISPQSTTISGETFGSRYVAGGFAGHDRRVLDDLGRWVSALSRSARAEQSLARNLQAANKLQADGVRAMLGHGGGAGGASGSGGNVLSAAPTGQLLNALGTSTTALMSASSELADARGGQLEAIEKKEREAKSGQQGTPGATPGPTPGGTVSPNPPPPPSPSGGGGSPTGGAPDANGGGGPGTTTDGGEAGKPPEDGPLARPLGSETELRPIEVPCEIIVYVIDGIEYAIGKFPDGYYLAIDQLDLEVARDDGTTVIIPDAYDFGDFDSDDPDLQPRKIDKAELDALVQKRQQATGQDGGPWATALSVTSFLLDLVPIIGQVKGGVELLTGYDLVTRTQLSIEERAISALFSLLPFVGGAIKSGAKRGLRAAQKAIRAGQPLSAANRQALSDALAEFRRLRTKRGAPRAEVKVKRCSDPNPRVGRNSLRRTRVRCFVAGTGVQTSDQGLIEIEHLSVQSRILAIPGAALRPSDAVPHAKPVQRVYRHRVQDTLRLGVCSAEGENHELTTTGAHLFATPLGYRAASSLRVGNTLLRAHGKLAQVTAISKCTEIALVFNLEVPDDHNYLVTPLALIVHNSCICSEGVSQGQAEELLDQQGFEFFHGTDDAGVDRFGRRGDPNFRPEPEFRDGQFTGRAGRQRNGAQIRGASSTTRPDLYGRENGQLVTYELKTPPSDFSTFNFFKKYKDSINKQINGRWCHMRDLGADHRLMIDARNTFEPEQGVINALRRLVSEGEIPALSEFYQGGVRIMGGTGSNPTMGRLIPWSEILQ